MKNLIGANMAIIKVQKGWNEAPTFWKNFLKANFVIESGCAGFSLCLDKILKRMNITLVATPKDISYDELVFETEEEVTLFLLRWS